MARIYPFPVVKPVWNSKLSDYPEMVKVSMDNGHVIDYVITVKEQKSKLKEMLDAFDKACFGGQKYKTKNIGKRTGRRMNNGNPGTDLR